MSEEEARALPVVVDLETAGKAFGLGRDKSHQLARCEQFPCQVLRIGRRYRVTKAAILGALGLPLEAAPDQSPEKVA